MSSPSWTHAHTHSVAPHATTPSPVRAHHYPRPGPAQRYLLEALCCRKRINHSLMPRPLATPAGQQCSSPAGQSAAAPLMSQIKKKTQKEEETHQLVNKVNTSHAPRSVFSTVHRKRSGDARARARLAEGKQNFASELRPRRRRSVEQQQQQHKRRQRPSILTALVMEAATRGSLVPPGRVAHTRRLRRARTIPTCDDDDCIHPRG